MRDPGKLLLLVLLNALCLAVGFIKTYIQYWRN